MSAKKWERAVQIALTAFLNDHTLSVLEVAPAVEERGFHSLWVGEHTHMPVATVHPYTPDGHLPDMYRRFADPLVTLAGAAGVTQRLRLGTNILLVAEHNPLLLAKQVATLDVMSGGRVELGVGYGWNQLEMRNNGIDPKRRRAVFREKLAAMCLLWSQETASFDGEFVSFTESWSWPKPLQQPRPPIHVGAGATPKNVDDIVRLADGWLPLKGIAGGDLGEQIAGLRHAATEVGRDPGDITVTFHDPDGLLGGSRSIEAFVQRRPTLDDVQRYADIGVDRLMLGVPTKDRSFMLQALDCLAELVVAG